MNGPTKIQLDSRLMTPIVGNGAIASAQTEGSLLPVLIVDASSRLDVREAVRLAKHSAPGDVISQWGMSGRIPVLQLKLINPVPAELIIPFRLPNEGILVDGILAQGAFMLQDGKPGDTHLGKDLDHQRLVVQVASEGFRDKWPPIYKRAMMEEFRRCGLGLMDSRRKADEAYEFLHSTASAQFQIR